MYLKKKLFQLFLGTVSNSNQSSQTDIGSNVNVTVELNHRNGGSSNLQNNLQSFCISEVKDKELGYLNL